MIVKCINNSVAAVSHAEVRKRLERTINLDGPMTFLDIGRLYPVQALEVFDGGLWMYLETGQSDAYPHPYPAEMFEVTDQQLPHGWTIQLQQESGSSRIKRVAFALWTNDDSFYERLVDDDAEAIALYRRHKLT